MKIIDVHVVRGAEGPSLQIGGPSGGTRVAGPKAWGNPNNRPVHSFTVAAEDLVKAIESDAYECDAALKEEVDHE